MISTRRVSVVSREFFMLAGTGPQRVIRSVLRSALQLGAGRDGTRGVQPALSGRRAPRVGRGIGMIPPYFFGKRAVGSGSVCQGDGGTPVSLRARESEHERSLQSPGAGGAKRNKRQSASPCDPDKLSPYRGGRAG